MPPAPTWAGEHDDADSAWAPEANDSGWAPPADPVVPSAPEPPVAAAPADASDGGGWTLPALSASAPPGPPSTAPPTSPQDDAAGNDQAAATDLDPAAPGELDDEMGAAGLPPLAPRRPSEAIAGTDADQREPGRPRSGLPFLGIQPVPGEPVPGPSTPPPAAPSSPNVADPSPPPWGEQRASGASTGAAAAGAAAAAAGASELRAPAAPVLLDPSAPSGVAGGGATAARTTPPGGAGAAAPPPGSGFLDLRPTTAAMAPAAADAPGRTSSPRGKRRLALVGVGAAVLLVVGLVAYQLSVDDDGSTDAVLTADAASIEASDSGEERGISLGVGDDEADAGAVAVEEGKAEAAEETTSDDGVVAAPEGAGGSGGGSGGGAPASPGRLAVSASSLDFGGGTSEVVSIRNEGGSSMSWSASTSGAGFSVASASSGSLSPGQAVNVTVAFSPNGVAEGTASGALNVSGGGSRSVSLRASVNRPPTISGVSWVSCGPTSRLRATVTDESGVSRVEVVGTSPAGPGFRKTAVSQGAGSYRADIGPFSSNGQITYFVEATDSRGNVARTGVQFRGWNNGC